MGGGYNFQKGVLFRSLPLFSGGINSLRKKIASLGANSCLKELTPNDNGDKNKNRRVASPSLKVHPFHLKLHVMWPFFLLPTFPVCYHIFLIIGNNLFFNYI